MKRKILFSIMVLTLLIPLFPLATSATPTTTQEEEVQQAEISPKLIDQILTTGNAPLKVLIETNTKDYDSITSQISELRGVVTHEFKYATGLSAEINANQIQMLLTNPNIIRISLDEVRNLASDTPTVNVNEMDAKLRSEEAINLNIENYEIISLDRQQLETQTALLEPNTYWNPQAMGAVDVWTQGYWGQDSLCVIIDTGVFAEHVMLGWAPFGPVVGGIDLSADAGDPTYEGFNNPFNHWHGTHVAGIFAGYAAILVPEDDILNLAYERYAGLTTTEYAEGIRIIPVSGMAPLAQIYGIKVFDHTGGAVPESMVIDAIEYAIDLHVSGTYDVDIISMSLGGGTGFDGYCLEDQIVDYATSVGITVVTAAGNEGPASMTVGSPGSAFTSITVGAAAHPVNTRIYWDVVNEWLGLGEYLYTSEIPQIYAFSSRGPTSDGRLKPTLAATGIYVLSAVTPGPGQPYSEGLLAWASGTSMACPAVSGAVALLNTWGENNGASPQDYKEALEEGANWLPGYDEYDQGAGYLNAGNSFTWLTNELDDCNNYDDHHHKIKHKAKCHYRRAPVQPKGINMHIRDAGTFEYQVEDLPPGHAVHFYFKATTRTDHIQVKISNVDLGIDPLEMNSFEFYVQSAVRTGYGYFIDSANVWGDATFDIYNYEITGDGYIFGFDFIQEGPIQPGYMRIVLENDWTSYDDLSGTIKITVEKAKRFVFPNEMYFGIMKTGDSFGWIPVGFGSSGVIIELWWLRNWMRFPTSDFDMYVIWYNTTGYEHIESAASLGSPEGVFINSSTIASVYVFISAYDTYGFYDLWNLRVYYV